MTNVQRTEADAVAQLSARHEMLDIEDVPHLLYPGHMQLASLEALLPAPKRIKGLYTFEEPKSFARYIEGFKEDGTRVFADYAEFRFLTVINGSQRDKPAHSDHRAILKMTKAPEWKAWTQCNGKRMNPRAFASFLENHLREITGSFKGGDLLEMCRNLRVSVKGDMAADETAEDGKRSLTFAASAQVRAARGDLQVAFPETIEVTLRVFNHVQPYTFEPRLRWDASDKGVEFWYDLVDPELVERAAFDQVVTEVDTATGLQAFVGWASGN